MLGRLVLVVSILLVSIGMAAPGAFALSFKLVNRNGIQKVEAKYPDGKKVYIEEEGFKEAEKAFAETEGKQGYSWESTVPNETDPIGWAPEVGKAVWKEAYEGVYDNTAKGKEWVQDTTEIMEKDGVLPEASTLMRYMGDVGLGVTAFTIGWTIGEGIATWAGLEGTEEYSPEPFKEVLHLVPPHLYFADPGHSNASECGTGGSNYLNWWSEGLCQGVLTVTSGNAHAVAPKETVGVYVHPGDYEWNGSIAAWFKPKPAECMKKWWYPTPDGVTVLGTEVGAAGCNSPYQTSVDEDGSFLTSEKLAQLMAKSGGFPGHKTFPPGTKTVTVPHPPPLTVAPPVPNVIPEWGPETMPPGELEPYIPEIPSPEREGQPDVPFAPELPPPVPNELATAYKTKIEGLGWKHVSIDTLPESAIDPNTGPGDAAYTDPSGKVEYETEVKIEMNPETAPAPNGEPSGFNPPSVPSIAWPKVSTPCNVFPFGIPCWLVSRLEEFVSPKVKAPVFVFNIAGHELKVDLSHAESVMEVFRTVELVVGTIGVVLLFGRFASSKTSSSDAGGE